ncbi:hypothetical protein TBR22_A46480 [Luteitalea sp. TBR-22]|uniref:DUF2891 domain-containing protein n=1 Tax=Luteitalea sp. TBR-22 TaxID=2802971 RepID=UPI001AFBDD10|nr:DUF2891 domain-containing protein [Luteitalea sp. TBR-22]BCS35421.1 hypothetical protein TBR22_A46480 [Luteitalea sp. TBR-22]
MLLALLLTIQAAGTPTMDLAQAEKLAALALACVHQEYPNKIAHTMASDADAKAPRDLTPVFYGCFDWHSAVHGHWLLARVARLYPGTPLAAKAEAALARNFTAQRVAGELAYLRAPGRQEFERPYGLAWLLQVTQELREWDSPQSREWARVLAPLEDEAVKRFMDWLPKLTRPIRTGEHSQTAFAFGLALDWARQAKHTAFEQLLVERSKAFYMSDRACPMAYEPSGQDFVSPCLAEADLMRRVLPPAEFSRWLTTFLPDIPRGTKADASWLEPGVVLDATDGKLAHLDGLNLSRAWMLEGIEQALADNDPRLPALHAAAERHREVGLKAVTGAHYAGGHWLGTFAVYLTSRRGIASR